MSMAIANFAALLFATGVAFWQLTLLRRQQGDETLRLRRGRALEYSIARAPHLRELRDKIDCVFLPEKYQGTAVPLDELKKAFAGDESVKTSLISLLAHWENLALTVAAGVTDEDMAFEMVASTLVAYVERFKEFIDDRRQPQGGEPNDRIYAYLLALAGRWSEPLRAGVPDARFEFPPQPEFRSVVS
jgi:hypothetical protein